MRKIKESLKKFWKKQKHKKTKGFMIFMLFVVGLIASNPFNVQDVQCADNYSNYLENSALNIVNDRAMIFQETATSSNEWRNLFESNFLFPAKLSNEMFSAYSTDYTRYSLGQVYLDNLDNDYAYASNNNSETIYTQQDFDNSDVTINNGSYIYSTKIVNEVIVPNSDITTEWSWYNISTDPYYSGLKYDTNQSCLALDEYPNKSITVNQGEFLDGVELYHGNESNILQMGFTNISANGIVNSIELRFYFNYVSVSNDMKVDFITTNSKSIGEKTLDIAYAESGQMDWFNLTWNDIFLNQTQINDLEIKITAPSNITQIYPTYVSNLQMSCLGVLVSSNVSIYDSEVNLGTSGDFPAEYSFGSDVDGSNPAGWSVVETGGTVNVISDLDGHTKVVELHDTSGSNLVSCRNTFSESSGTIEFWVRVDSNTDCSTIQIEDGYGSLHEIYIQFDSTGQITYYDGANHNIQAYSVDTWYHFRIEFDCSTDWHLWIDGVSKDGGSGYNYRGSPTVIDTLIFITRNSDVNYYIYIDAIDYSWSSGYYTNRNYYSKVSYIELDLESNIDYLGITEYNPIYLDLYLSYCSNISTKITTYIYNYDTLTYNSIVQNSDVNEFNLLNFRFNETGQYRLNKFKIRISSEIVDYDFRLFTQNIHLNITYVKTNSLGYNLIETKINRKTDGGTLRGYFLFQVKLYDGYMMYRYLESNIVENDYEISWIMYNYSQYLNSDLETLEIQTHCRYGLNTLDMDISNIRVEIWFNNEHEFTFIEQERMGSFDAKQYNTNLNYTSFNRNYLNLTGVFGNYSYNSLAGIRVLQGQNDEIYNRFFTIPFFLQNLDVYIPPIDPDSYAIDDEPPAPKGAEYWTYTSFRIIPSTTVDTAVGNWTVEFTQIDVEEYTVKFFYNSESVNKKSLGDWSFKISEWKISFNFIRDAIVWIINIILLFLQFLLYLVVASLSFVFMFLGCYIVVLLWNFAVFYMYIGICWVGWFIVEFFYWLYSVLVWLWANIIYPFLQWCYNVLLPLIITAIIMIIAFMITVFIYILTLGSVDFWDTYDMVESILWMIVDFVLEWILVFGSNMFHLLLFIFWYLINMALVYFRYLYNRARGNINRAEQLYYTFQIYIAPIVFIYDLLKKLLESTPEL